MEKIKLAVGNNYVGGARKMVQFTGEEVAALTVNTDPGHDSRGYAQTLYKVKNGYRVYEKHWSHWQGEQGDNTLDLSDVLTEEELLDQYTALANRADLFKTVDLDEDPDALSE